MPRSARSAKGPAKFSGLSLADRFWESWWINCSRKSRVASPETTFIMVPSRRWRTHWLTEKNYQLRLSTLDSRLSCRQLPSLDTPLHCPKPASFIQLQPSSAVLRHAPLLVVGRPAEERVFL